MAADVGSPMSTSTSGNGLRYQGALHCLSSTYREGRTTLGGIRAVYSGFSLSFFAGIFFRSLHLGGYDIAKFLLKEFQKDNSLSWKFVAAQVSNESSDRGFDSFTN